MMEYTDTERQQALPVDLKKEEFVAFHMVTSKAFGALKRQGMTIALFAVYFVLTVFGLVATYRDSGTVSWVMLMMSAVTMLAVIFSMTAIPLRVKKQAEKAYDAGDINGYYGEWYITATQIVKILGEERVEMPLNEKTLYIEDEAFMAFMTVGTPRVIILPARAMTAQAAKQVREAVFGETSRVQRRVIRRMTAAAQSPIERRALLTAPQTLYTMDVTYEDAELKRLHADIAWKQYIKNLPTFSFIAVMVAALFAMNEENLLLFFAVLLAVMLGFLGFSVLAGAMSGKRAVQSEARTRMRLTLTEHGLDAFFEPSAQRVTAHWKSVSRAVERPDCVEFYCMNDQLLRVPKRCIENMDTLRDVVDTCRASAETRS